MFDVHLFKRSRFTKAGFIEETAVPPGLKGLFMRWIQQRVVFERKFHGGSKPSNNHDDRSRGGKITGPGEN
jgi:hypothetical protein